MIAVIALLIAEAMLLAICWGFWTGRLLWRGQIEFGCKVCELREAEELAEWEALVEEAARELRRGIGDGGAG